MTKFITDEPKEVTNDTYKYLQKYWSGCFASRETNGKIQVKIWLYCDIINQRLGL